MSWPEYLFGDSDKAARRLELLARVFKESTRAFLVNAAGSVRFRVALDLGCGPGFTTHLIADTLLCDRIIGFDASASFIRRARATAGERMSFLEQDITSVPLSSVRANLIFARFLLPHLHNPEAVIAKWASQLERDGLLLLEETESIHTIHPAFTRYLAIVEAMLTNQGNCLYVGQLIGGFDYPGGLISSFNELRKLPVRNRDAARMFALNLGTWKDSEFIRANYSRDSIQRLEQALAEIAITESSAQEIQWKIRQTAWRRS
jgi:trans-aconitate 2-methyltransferase